MKGRFFTDLQSYEKTVEDSASFCLTVTLKDVKQTVVMSTAMPIDVLEEALEDLRLIDEGMSLPVWNRSNGQLTIIPAKEILNVRVDLINKG